MNRVWRHLRWTAFLALWGVLGSASAEPLYRLPSLRDERGIEAGAFHLWPEVFVETRYDTNLFRRSDEEIDYNKKLLGGRYGFSPEGLAYTGRLDADGQKDTYVDTKPAALILRAMPSFECNNPGGRLVQFHFAGMGDFRGYFAKEQSAIVKAQGKVGGNVRTRVLLFPKGMFQFFVEDRFDRSLQSRNDVSRETFTRMLNEAGAGVIIRPAQALSLELRYGLSRDVFVEFDVADKLEHQAGLVGRWKFFPRTEAFVDASVGFLSYDVPRMLGTPQVQIGNFSSTPVRARAGLNGYITRRIFVLLAGGYGNSMHSGGASYQGFLAKALVGYEIPNLLVVQGGYERSFEDSLFANFFARDGVELWGQLRLWNMVDLEAGAKYQFVNYGKAVVVPSIAYSEASRSDNLLVVKADVSMNFLRYLGVNLGVAFSDVMTDFYSMDVASQFRDYGSFSKLEVFANIVGRY